jgi:hypothetical protein
VRWGRLRRPICRRARVGAAVGQLRLRRAPTTETGLFEIQANHLTEFRRKRRVAPDTRQIVCAMFEQPCSFDADTSLKPTTGEPKSTSLTSNPTVDFARCFLRRTNLPNFALDRITRYEATLWRQAGQILFALDALDRRKSQDRGRPFPCWQPRRNAALRAR